MGICKFFRTVICVRSLHPRLSPSTCPQQLNDNGWSQRSGDPNQQQIDDERHYRTSEPFRRHTTPARASSTTHNTHRRVYHDRQSSFGPAYDRLREIEARDRSRTSLAAATRRAMSTGFRAREQDEYDLDEDEDRYKSEVEYEYPDTRNPWGDRRLFGFGGFDFEPQLMQMFGGAFTPMWW